MKQLCPNCQVHTIEKYCPNCGQKKLKKDRSLLHLSSELVNTLFFVDSRVWLSVRYLFFRPGLMTYEYVEGKRRKFLPPITIFLFINLVYFFFSPLTDFSLHVEDQMQQPLHGQLAKSMVERKLKHEDLSIEEYGQIYQHKSDQISKAVMILNVPMIALFVYLLSLKKRKYYFDSVIFSIHFFTVVLFSICIGVILYSILGRLTVPVNHQGIWLTLFLLVIPLLYLIISFRKFNNTRWVTAVWSGIVIMGGTMVTHFLYRGIVFFLFSAP